MKKIFMGIWLSIWAAPIMIFSGLVFIVLKILGFKHYKGNDIIVFEIGEYWGGLNLGWVVLASKKASQHTLVHESGHLYQMMYFGILTPLLIHLPSSIRYHYHNYLARKKSVQPPEYDSIGFEGTASALGYKICLNKKYEGKKLRK